MISSRYRPASPAVFAVVVFEGRIEEPAPVASLTEKFQRFSRSFEWFFEVALPPIRSFFLFLPLSFLLLSSFDHPCPSGGPASVCIYVCMRAKVSKLRGFPSRGGGRGRGLHWGTWRIKLANKPPFVKATKLFIDEKTKSRREGSDVTKERKRGGNQRDMISEIDPGGEKN